MTVDEKVIIAKQLEKLRVDIIEAGFAAASAGDYSAVSEVAKNIKNSTVCSLARAMPRDIKAAGEAVSYARKNRIHTFIATSPIHMEKKLRRSQRSKDVEYTHGPATPCVPLQHPAGTHGTSSPSGDARGWYK